MNKVYKARAIISSKMIWTMLSSSLFVVDTPDSGNTVIAVSSSSLSSRNMVKFDSDVTVVSVSSSSLSSKKIVKSDIYVTVVSESDISSSVSFSVDRSDENVEAVSALTSSYVLSWTTLRPLAVLTVSTQLRNEAAELVSLWTLNLSNCNTKRKKYRLTYCFNGDILSLTCVILIFNKFAV